MKTLYMSCKEKAGQVSSLREQWKSNKCLIAVAVVLIAIQIESVLKDNTGAAFYAYLAWAPFSIMCEYQYICMVLT